MQRQCGSPHQALTLETFTIELELRLESLHHQVDTYRRGISRNLLGWKEAEMAIESRSPINRPSELCSRRFRVRIAVAIAVSLNRILSIKE